MMKIKEGKFITITGIDGAGKSTQSSLLSSALLSRGGLVERVEAKNPFFDDAVLDLTATEHRSLLWPKGDFPHQKRGTLYYLYLHASWFSCFVVFSFRQRDNIPKDPRWSVIDL